jgi:hypothetical protein
MWRSQKKPHRFLREVTMQEMKELCGQAGFTAMLPGIKGSLKD